MRYSDSRNGAEHLWGFGNLRLSCVTNSSLATVVTGCRVPGICIEIGSENFGLSLGWLERQRLQVVNQQSAGAVMIPGATPRFLSHAGSDGIWALGHLKMRTVPAPEHHYAIVTGRALAGIGGDAGPGERGFGAGLNHGQRTEVIDENVRVDLDMRASRWPGFDYFSAEVSAATPMDLKTNKHNQTP